MVRLKEIMKVGPKGQIVIPKYFRKEKKIFPGSEVIIILEEDSIIIKNPSSEILNTIDNIAKKSKIEKILKPHEAYARELNERHKIKK